MTTARRDSIVALGGSGFVGSRVVELWRSGGLNVLAPTHAQLDVLDEAALSIFLERTPTTTVVNFVAWADVDGAESERGDTQGRVHALNVTFPSTLAAACRGVGSHLIHISTDYVFDGTNAERPYREDDPIKPLGWYGMTKAAGEEAVLRAAPEACIARIEMPFSGLELPKKDVARIFHSRLSAGQTITGVVDQYITPLFLDDAAAALRLLVDARHSGIIHLASTTWTTPYQYAQAIASRLELNADLIKAQRLEEFARGRAAPRPQHSWLDVSRFEQLFGSDVLQSVDSELDRWLAQRLTAMAT